MKHRLSKQQSRSVIESFILNDNDINIEILSTFIVSLGRSQMYKSFDSLEHFINDLIIFSTSALCMYKTGIEYDELRKYVFEKFLRVRI